MATETKAKLATAKIGFIRQTSRKVRRTVNLIRNMSAGDAVAQLKFMPYEACDLICKMIESAMANASNNLGIESPEDLRISQILVDDGVTYKRWRAASKGRAYSILKRTCKASVVLSEMKPGEYAKYVWANSSRNRKNRKSVVETGAATEAKAPKAAAEPKAKKSTTKSKAKKAGNEGDNN